MTKSIGKKRSGPARNRMCAALGSMYKFGAQKFGAKNNPARDAIRAPESRKLDRILSDEELPKLLQACRNSDYDQLYLLVALAIGTGARRGELLNLRWEYVDLNAKIATLPTTKNGTSRNQLCSIQVIRGCRDRLGINLNYHASLLRWLSLQIPGADAVDFSAV